MIPILVNEHGTEFQMREQRNKTERNSENRVYKLLVDELLPHVVDEFSSPRIRSLVELVHKCVPNRIEAKKTFYWLSSDYSSLAYYGMAN